MQGWFGWLVVGFDVQVVYVVLLLKWVGCCVAVKVLVVLLFVGGVVWMVEFVWCVVIWLVDLCMVVGEWCMVMFVDCMVVVFDIDMVFDVCFDDVVCCLCLLCGMVMVISGYDDCLFVWLFVVVIV